MPWGEVFRVLSVETRQVRKRPRWKQKSNRRLELKCHWTRQVRSRARFFRQEANQTTLMVFSWRMYPLRLVVKRRNWSARSRPSCQK
jgi:hypothetical protein